MELSAIMDIAMVIAIKANALIAFWIIIDIFGKMSIERMKMWLILCVFFWVLAKIFLGLERKVGMRI